VIALDASAASRALEIGRYVASGGGLILARGAASIGAFSALRPGTPGRAQSPPGPSSGPVSRRSLPLVPLVNLRNDAARLEQRGSLTATAARRHAMGRVLHQGYSDTWRWRMNGDDRSVEEHRAWWTNAVASVAHRDMRAWADTLDNAPLARLVATLGPSSAPRAQSLSSAAGSVPMWWLLAGLIAALLAEWASRRLRGAR
jgi:hypothetical protein